MMKMNDSERYEPKKHGHIAYQHTPSIVPIKADELAADAEHAEFAVFGSSIYGIVRRHFSGIHVDNLSTQ